MYNKLQTILIALQSGVYSESQAIGEVINLGLLRKENIGKSLDITKLLSTLIKLYKSEGRGWNICLIKSWDMKVTN